MTDEPVLSFRNVSFGYGDVPALTAIDLAIKHREFVGLVGPNGGGKSTLVKLALGLMPPDEGEVLLFGAPPQEGRTDVGYVPQQFQFRRDFPITALETVLMGRLGHGGFFGRYRNVDKEEALVGLDRAGVADLARRPLASLSGGQLQRVLIARALTTRPKMMILDEPTANVDTQAEQSLFDLLRQLNDELTIVVVSHDIGFISGYITTVACLNRTLVFHDTNPTEPGSLVEKMYGAPMAGIHHCTHLPGHEH